MAFYQRKVTYDELAPHVKKFRDYLRRSAVMLRDSDDDNNEAFQDAYLVTEEQFKFLTHTYTREYNALLSAKLIQLSPWGPNQGACIYFFKEADGMVNTVSPTHIRMPKLSYLITLTPQDFFALFKIIAEAKNTQSKDSLSINPMVVGIHNLATSSLDPFFLKLRTNYRINPEYCDQKWTSRDDIRFIADLEPTRENQLSAMQYITVRQNTDILYFPVETAVDLELDWQQISDDYVVPPNEG